MPKLEELCRHIRSKAAGPFWITIDLFFKDEASYKAYARHPAISAALIEKLYAVPAEWVKIIHVDSLQVVKISYPRPEAQGWFGERDMHGGQQYVALAATELASTNAALPDDNLVTA